jgi:hypothetical protein
VDPEREFAAGNLDGTNIDQVAPKLRKSRSVDWSKNVFLKQPCARDAARHVLKQILSESWTCLGRCFISAAPGFNFVDLGWI